MPGKGLFKGSTCQGGEGLPRTSPAERPKTLRKLKNVYENTALPDGFEDGGPKRSGRGGPGGGGMGGQSQIDKSLSILSPFDEQEEWAKISEIMASFGTGLVRDSLFVSELEKELQARLGLSSSTASSPMAGSPVGQWLATLKMVDYESLFLNNGYDDLDFLNGVLEGHDLKEMGIDSENDQKEILEAVKLLPCKIDDIKSKSNLDDTVESWLKSIHLDSYVDTFHKHLYKDMDRVKRIWEVELTAVLEIHRPGHRKRILISVSSHRPLQQQGPNLEDINADLNQLKSNIQQLKDEIREKLPVGTNAGNSGTLRHSHKKSRPAPPPPMVATNGPENGADLEIRDPSELLVGVPATLTTQWRHRPHVLVTGSVNYLANYLGSTIVKELRGTESTKKSIQKLKKSTKEPKMTPDIVLAISFRGVKFLNPVAQELVCEHEIRNIHCACQDADDLTHFAYITKDHVSKSHYCHVFCVQTMDQATEVILTLGQAFEVAYQMALREQFSTGCRSSNGHTRSQSVNQILSVSSGSTSSSIVTPNHSRSLSVNEIKINGKQQSVDEDTENNGPTQPGAVSGTDPSSSPKNDGPHAPLVQTEEL